MKLDIACGQCKPPGYFGIDIADCAGVDIRHDLTTFPWPIASGVVVDSQCHHFFEHVPRLLRPAFMSEVWRILAPDCGIRIVTPLGIQRQFQDFTHEWPVFPESFLYFQRPWLVSQGLDHYIDLYGIHCNFEVVESFATLADEVIGREPAEQVRAIRNDMGAANDLVTVLRKLPL
jgi:hypothetical protein